MDFNSAFNGPAPEIIKGAGLVHVSIPYEVEPHKIAEFVTIMRQLRRQRLRNGADRWDLLSGSKFGDYIEQFSFKSTAEFARQRGRITRWEMEIEQRVLALHARPNLGANGHWTLWPIEPSPAAGRAQAEPRTNDRLGGLCV